MVRPKTTQILTMEMAVVILDPRLGRGPGPTPALEAIDIDPDILPLCFFASSLLRSDTLLRFCFFFALFYILLVV